MGAPIPTPSATYTVGVSRRLITPLWGVELAGLGYYLNRLGERIRDDLTATALIITDSQNRSVAILALDLMYNDAAFTGAIREQIAANTDLRPESICVNCSHTHNAPTAGFIRGAGEIDPLYLRYAGQQAAAAAIHAWRNRAPAHLRVGHSELPGMTFNRTRENGPVDTRVSILRADTPEGKPLALAVNFHSHCTAHMEIDLRAISRDWPGEVVDQLEAALPGVTAMYWQGTCGDVNFRREFNNTDRRFEPARALTRAALTASENSRPIPASNINALTRTVSLPTRRWTDEEIQRDREEALHRLQTSDTTDWLTGPARVMVNQPERLPLRYNGSVEKTVAALARFALEWTDDILPHLSTRPESLETEIQALRIGDTYLIANPSELFTTLGLSVRASWPSPDLFMLSYSNGSIGYLPDAHDIERRTYAAIQSPKFTAQFPFTPASGPAMVQAMLAALESVRSQDGTMQ